MVASHQVSFRSVSLPGRLDSISFWGDIKFWVFSTEFCLDHGLTTRGISVAHRSRPAADSCQGATQLQDPDPCIGVYRARGVLGNSVSEGGSERSRDQII